MRFTASSRSGFPGTPSPRLRNDSSAAAPPSSSRAAEAVTASASAWQGAEEPQWGSALDLHSAESQLQPQSVRLDLGRNSSARDPLGFFSTLLTAARPSELALGNLRPSQAE